jgi:SAM-dependent methyltransferase
MKIHNYLTVKITRERLKRFIQNQANERYTLDIGCANSPYSHYFPNRVGFDIVPGPGVDVVGDAHSLPFPDASFEQILCTEVLEHLHTPEQAIAEMHRVLKPGGIILLTTRFIFPIHDAPHDYYRYTKYGLRHLFRDWDIMSLEEEVDTFGALAVLLQRIGYQTHLRLNSVMKAILFLSARILRTGGWFIRSEYGDIQRTVPETAILTSGYYLVARRKEFVAE